MRTEGESRRGWALGWIEANGKTDAPASDDENTVKVTPRKEIRPNGTIKLKRPAPKHNKPGNWRDGSVVDGAFSLLFLRVLGEVKERVAEIWGWRLRIRE